MCCEYPNFLSLLYRALAKYAQNITIPTHMPRCVIENQTLQGWSTNIGRQLQNYA